MEAMLSYLVMQTKYRKFKSFCKLSLENIDKANFWWNTKYYELKNKF